LVGTCSFFSEHLIEILTVIIADFVMEAYFRAIDLEESTKWFNPFNAYAMKKMLLSVAVHLGVSTWLKSDEGHLLLTGVWA
jgi:hypothetical protein